MRKIGKIALIVLALNLILSFVALAEPGIINTGGGTVNFRKAPEDRAKIITRIKNRTMIEVLNHSDGWYHVSYEGKEGFIKEPFVQVLSESIGKDIYSNGSTIFLYDSKDEQSKIIGMLNAQQSMTIESIDSEWAFVSTGSIKGYTQTAQIDQFNEAPADSVSREWVEGILQADIILYSEPDNQSDILSTWSRGQGVSVYSYNKKWSLVQILDEGVCGFAKKTSVQLNPMPAQKKMVDDSQFIAPAKAESIAVKALKKYSGFNPGVLTCSQDIALSTDGIRGPMYRFNYTNSKGQYLYAAYIHANTGEVLYTGDYSAFIAKQDISDLKTAAPRVTPSPSDEDTSEDQGEWSKPYPEPASGVEIGEDAARAIADRYLSAKYPRFSELTFSRVSCRHITDPMVDVNFQVPFYMFDYYINDGSEDSASEQLVYGIYINSVTEEIEYCCSAALGEGNG